MKRVMMFIVLILLTGCATDSIQDRYPDDVQRQVVLQNLASELEMILTVEDFSKVNTTSLFNAIDCVSLHAEGRKDALFIENLVFDTDEKAEIYIDFNEYHSGTVFGSEFKEPDCDFG